MRCLRPAKLNIILYRICKQIYRLEYEGEIAHKAVHTVIFYVHTAQCHRSGIHIPESCDQITQSRFTATGWSDDRSRCFFRNGKRDAINDLSLIIGKCYI